MKKGFTLVDLLVVLAVLLVLAALLMPALAVARKSSKKRDCADNLRQLGAYVTVYVARHGQDRAYPPASGQNFFNTLRTVPAGEAVVKDNALFVCKVLGTSPSPTNLDYRNANAAAYGAAKMGDSVTMPCYPIGADKTNNHDINGMDDINVLYFDGSVVSATHGDVNWTLAIVNNYTN